MPATLTPADARELIERALWFSRQDLFDVPGADERRSLFRESSAETRHEHAARALLAASVRLAAYSGDPQLLPLVLAALDAYPSSEELDGIEPLEPFADAIRWLLQLGAPVDAQIRALAHHPEADIRQALVHGLKDAAAEFEGLLRPLAGDRDAKVRSAAKAVLATLGTPPWWVGVFSFDPGTVIPEEDGPALSTKLARYAELVNQPHGTFGETREELHRIIDELPDVLAKDAVFRQLAGERYSVDEDRLAARLARIPDTVGSVVELLEHSERFRHHEFARGWAAAATGDREAMARAVIAAIERRNPSERLDASQPTWTLTDLASHLWPADGDATDLVERVLAEVDEANDDDLRIDAFVSMVDSMASHSPRTLERCGARLVAAFLDGDPNRWCRRLHRSTRAALAALPLDARRDAAQRAIASPNDEVVHWALDQVLGASHDPARDPSVDELFDQLTADDRLRELLAYRHEHVKRHRQPFLALLHAGRLSPNAAARVLTALSAPGQTMRDAYIHGGLFVELPLPPADAPPLTAEDFAALRRIRDAHPGPPTHDNLFAMPASDLCPEDRRYVERALETGDTTLDTGIAVAYAMGGTAADLPIVERLARRADSEDTLGELPDVMKARLGLIPPKVRGRPGAKFADVDDPKEWMDEDD